MAEPRPILCKDSHFALTECIFRKKMHYHSAFFAISNPLLHFKSQSTAFYEVGMLYGEAAHFTPVPPHAPHERTCRAAVALRLDDEFFAVGEMKGYGGEQWVPRA